MQETSLIVPMGRYTTHATVLDAVHESGFWVPDHGDQKILPGDTAGGTRRNRLTVNAAML